MIFYLKDYHDFTPQLCHGNLCLESLRFKYRSELDSRYNHESFRWSSQHIFSCHCTIVTFPAGCFAVTSSSKIFPSVTRVWGSQISSNFSSPGFHVAKNILSFCHENCSLILSAMISRRRNKQNSTDLFLWFLFTDIFSLISLQRYLLTDLSSLISLHWYLFTNLLSALMWRCGEASWQTSFAGLLFSHYENDTDDEAELFQDWKSFPSFGHSFVSIRSVTL